MQKILSVLIHGNYRACRTALVVVTITSIFAKNGITEFNNA